jgi:hypothetical protein
MSKRGIVLSDQMYGGVDHARPALAVQAAASASTGRTAAGRTAAKSGMPEREARARASQSASALIPPRHAAQYGHAPENVRTPLPPPPHLSHPVSLSISPCPPPVYFVCRMLETPPPVKVSQLRN